MAWCRGGKITGQTAESPTLTFNTIGRHISRMVYTKVVLINRRGFPARTSGIHTNPASHGEGRFVASEDSIRSPVENGQVATQYCTRDGLVTMDEEYNINGS